MATKAHVKLVKREGAAYKRIITASSGGGEHFTVKVGFLGDGAARDDGALTNPQLAAVHEFGAPEVHVQERPFMSPSFDANLPKYKAFMQRIAVGVSSGKVSLEQGMGLLGTMMAADVRDFIVGGAPIAPENAESVKARKLAKGLNTEWGLRTLVDTGQLVNSITWVVVRGDGKE